MRDFYLHLASHCAAHTATLQIEIEIHPSVSKRSISHSNFRNRSCYTTGKLRLRQVPLGGVKEQLAASLYPVLSSLVYDTGADSILVQVHFM